MFSNKSKIFITAFFISAIILLFNGHVIKEYNNHLKSIPSYDTEKEKDTTVDLKELTYLIYQYENAMVEAINQNDFSILEPYLIPDSNLYHAQKKLISHLNKRGIKEKLLEFQVEDTRIVDDKYNVYVYEKFNITYGDGTSRIKEFHYIYEIPKNTSKLALSDIFKNEEKNISSDTIEELTSDIKEKYEEDDDYESTDDLDYYPTYINEVCTSPSTHMNKKIQISGTVIFIKENYASQNILISNGENIIHVYCYKKIKLFKGDSIDIYGKVIGETSDYSLIKDTPATIPSMYGDYIYVSKSH